MAAAYGFMTNWQIIPMMAFMKPGHIYSLVANNGFALFQPQGIFYAEEVKAFEKNGFTVVACNLCWSDTQWKNTIVPCQLGSLVGVQCIWCGTPSLGCSWYWRR